ncbi:MAG: hypothetical protein M3Y29_06625 [Chloroflexota bacterium]|jgi:hypothetical protein|nr:hypothetical protein [Chloroflexota bacterium]
MTPVQLAAVAAGALMAVTVAFQLALAAGMPWGDATMGGRARHVDGVLAPPYRVMALLSAVLLAVAALIVVSRAGVVDMGLPDPVRLIGTWLVVAFSILNTLTNLSGRHPLERFGFSAITLAVAILAAYVALAAPA